MCGTSPEGNYKPRLTFRSDVSLLCLPPFASSFGPPVGARERVEGLVNTNNNPWQDTGVRERRVAGVDLGLSLNVLSY